MQWSSLLEQANAAPSPTDNYTTYFAPLTEMGLIHVSGGDAASFLQNMFTNDVSALHHNQAQLNGLCNPKGRLLAVFLLIKQDNDFFILLPTELVDPIMQRLNMFKLRSDVTLTKQDDVHVLGGLGRASTDAKLTPIFVPNAPSMQIYLVSDDVINELSMDGQLLNENYWYKAWLEAGLAMVFKSSQEAFTPQQVNLDLVGGVSFKKGCYPGQEVVARMHYLGSPSRRLFLAELAGSDIPAPNTEVTSEDGEVLGHVVSARPSTDGVLCQLTLKLDKVSIPGFVVKQAVNKLIALAEGDD